MKCDVGSIMWNQDAIHKTGSTEEDGDMATINMHKNLWKFGRAVTEMQADRKKDRQTDRQIDLHVLLYHQVTRMCPLWCRIQRKRRRRLEEKSDLQLVTDYRIY